jgi:signal transduction histidine kinase
VRLIDATRSISFRIAALTTLLVLISMATLGAAIYSFVDGALESRVKGRIEEEMGRLLARNDPSEPQTVIAEVARRTRADTTRRYAYRIVTTDGGHVVGDIWIQKSRPGWQTQEVPDDTESAISGGHILVLTAPLSPNLVLSIGRDIHWIADVEEELLEILGWALLAGIALAALTAFLANRLVARRIDLVTGAAVAIMDGDLKHRVPLTGARDDFDRLSQTLNAMLKRIQGLMENLEQVTNDIAHDLRTPLGRLRQGLEDVRSKSTSTHDYERAVDRAIAEADGLLATFTALLRIAQVEAGVRRAAFREVDLSDVMRSVGEAYELSAEEGDRALKTVVADGVHIPGDRDLLVQMFANLIENALTHTPAGTTITVSLAKTTSGTVAAVADDGPGVPEEERDKIFLRFYRRENSRTTPGTGLGLSLVVAVAKLHRAHLQAGNNHPGLCISVTFPTHEIA